MYKEIVGITQSYLDERISQLEDDLKILQKFEVEGTAYKAVEWVIQELDSVRKTMLNACDYGIWLKEHKEEEQC